jgi:hypothetical protein
MPRTMLTNQHWQKLKVILRNLSIMPVTDAGQNGELLKPEKGKQTEIRMKLQALS